MEPAVPTNCFPDPTSHRAKILGTSLRFTSREWVSRESIDLSCNSMRELACETASTYSYVSKRRLRRDR